MGFSSDVLEIEVKDRFAKSRPSISRFLGKRKIQLSTLMRERNLRRIEWIYFLKRFIENGVRSYFGFWPVAKSARISPVSGDILNPWPENPAAIVMLSWAGCLSNMKSSSGVVWNDFHRSERENTSIYCVNARFQNRWTIFEIDTGELFFQKWSQAF